MRTLNLLAVVTISSALAACSSFKEDFTHRLEAESREAIFLDSQAGAAVAAAQDKALEKGDDSFAEFLQEILQRRRNACGPIRESIELYAQGRKDQISWFRIERFMESCTSFSKELLSIFPVPPEFALP